jgi:hypothetical protein
LKNGSGKTLDLESLFRNGFGAIFNKVERKSEGHPRIATMVVNSCWEFIALRVL